MTGDAARPDPTSPDQPLSELALAVDVGPASFDGTRLRLARERNGLNRTGLAEAVGVSPAAIGQFESRKARPSTGTIAGLAQHLGVSVAYFAAGRVLCEPDPTRTHFRSLRSTRTRERQQALASMAHLAEVTRVLGRAVQLPNGLDELDLTGSSPGAAARQLRLAWQFGSRPLLQLVAHMEARGVVVSVARFAAAARIDAFSCWIDSRPYVCLSKDRSAPLRRRFSAAHELGHLLLHRQTVPGSAECEREADLFAAELLMPSGPLAEVLPRRLDLVALYELQPVWGVSAAALLRRSRELGIVDERAYRTGCVLLARSTFSFAGDVPELRGEWPSLLLSAVNAAADLGLDVDVLAAGLALPVAEVEELLGVRRDERAPLTLVVD